MVSYTSEPQFECGICHKNTELLTDKALCPKKSNPQLHCCKNFKMWKRFTPSPKHSDWIYGHLACGIHRPFPSG